MTERESNSPKEIDVGAIIRQQERDFHFVRVERGERGLTPYPSSREVLEGAERIFKENVDPITGETHWERVPDTDSEETPKLGSHSLP